MYDVKRNSNTRVRPDSGDDRPQRVIFLGGSCGASHQWAVLRHEEHGPAPCVQKITNNLLRRAGCWKAS